MNKWVLVLGGPLSGKKHLVRSVIGNISISANGYEPEKAGEWQLVNPLILNTTPIPHEAKIILTSTTTSDLSPSCLSCFNVVCLKQQFPFK